MDAAFWKNKKVLITGHTGFKGSWLALWLQSLGAHVIGYALPPTTVPNLFELAEVKELTHSQFGDIRDFDALYNFIHKEKPEIVFHLAAQALVRYSYANPVETYAINVMGTVNLLEVLKRVNCAQAVVVVTSDKCYENREWDRGYKETDSMGGYDPYSSSKGCAEIATAAYRQSFFNDTSPLFLASARAGNVIGGGDWAMDRLIPDFLRAIMNKQPLKVRYPSAIRPWQHVLEPLSGYLLLAEHLYKKRNDFTGGWNFGPDDQDAKSVEWIANHLVHLWGEGARWELDNQEKKLHEARYLKLDISKARSELKWAPRWSLEKALYFTVEWYKAHCHHQNVQKVMREQIAEYYVS